MELRKKGDWGQLLGLMTRGRKWVAVREKELKRKGEKPLSG